MFATRWKLRAKASAKLSNKGANKDTLLAISSVIKADDVKRTKNDFTKDEAAIEIQRHIKGLLTRKKVRPMLLQRLAIAVERNAPGNFVVQLANINTNELPAHYLTRWYMVPITFFRMFSVPK